MSIAIALGLLVAVYALTLASADPLDLLAGTVVGLLLLLLVLRGFLFTGAAPPARDVLARILLLPRLTLALAAEIVRGTWTVTLVVIGVRPLARPGIVAVPIGDRTARGVAVSALAMTLSPGEVFVDVDWARRVMLVHVIDATDPDTVRRHHSRFYERYQRPVFP